MFTSISGSSDDSYLEGTGEGAAVVEVRVLSDNEEGMETVPMVDGAMVGERMIEASGTKTRDEGPEAVALGIEDEAEALRAEGIEVQ